MVNNYYSQQVCINGHVVTDNYENSGGSEFCKECGAKTITNCEECGGQIPGDLINSNVVIIMESFPDKYCPHCGAAYPWTQMLIDASKELAQEFEELSSQDRKTIVESIPDLINDTPRTELASKRFKRILTNAGHGIYDSFYRLLVDVLSETAKKTLTNG